MISNAPTLRKSGYLTRLVPAMLLLATGLASAQTTSTTTTTPLAPTVTSLAPTIVVAGSPAFNLLVNGTNFAANSQVYLGDKYLATSFVSATQLSATVPATAIARPRTPSVFVYNGRRNGGLSNAIQLPITPSTPAPIVTSLSANTMVAGSPARTLTITGTNFGAGSQVFLGRTLLTNNSVSATQIVAAVPATALTNPGQFPVVVSNGVSSGASTPIAFTVTPANAPTVTTLSPTTVVAGSPAFTLTVNGTNFVSGSQVYLGNTYLATSFISATQLTATVPANAIARPRTASVLVYNGRRNGGASTAIPFQITPSSPSPTVTLLNPTTVQAGAAATTITVTGTNFGAGSQVIFGRTPLVTTLVGPTQLTAVIPASALAYANQVPVVVNNGISSGVSMPLAFTVTPPTAQVVYLSSRRSTAANSGIYVQYQVVASAMLDLTQPVTLTVAAPATVSAAAVTIFGPQSFTLTPSAYTDRNGMTITYYQAQSSTQIIYVLPQANNQYVVEFEALGVDLSKVNETSPVTVSLTFGAQAFSAQAQPFQVRQ